MVVPPIEPEVAFSVTCDVCKKSDTLIFRGGLFPGLGIKRDMPVKVPLGYRHVPMDSASDDDFRLNPVKGVLGDRLPVACPVCGTKLASYPVKLHR